MKEFVLLTLVASSFFGLAQLKDPTQTYAYKANEHSLERIAEISHPTFDSSSIVISERRD